MKLSFLFLIIASTSFESVDMALTSSESERTKAVEFHTFPTYWRANSTIEQEDEERWKRPPKLTNEEILARFEVLFSKLTHFNSKAIKDFTMNYIKNVKSAGMKYQKATQKKTHVFYSLLEPTFLEDLRRKNSLFYENYIDLALYLALLESVEGSLFSAAKQIYDAVILAEKIKQFDAETKAKGMEKRKKGLVLKRAEDILYDQDAVEILYRMEEGQFILWINCLGYLNEVKRNIFGTKNSNEWMDKVGDRYSSFLSDWEKHEIPGMKSSELAEHLCISRH